MQEVTVQSSVAQQQDTPNERIGIGAICGDLFRCNLWIIMLIFIL